GKADVSGCRAAQHDRALKDHGLAPAQRRARAAAPADSPGGGLDQPVAEPQQQALSRAIGAENDGARTGRELDIDLRDPHLAPRGIAHAFQAERQDGGAVALLAEGGHGWRPVKSRMTKAAPFTPSDRTIRMIPRPSASARSPFEVSSAIAVVIIRVTWSILPPTIMTAPPSALARPKPASSAVMRLKRPSQRRVAIARRGPQPSDCSCSRYSIQRSSTSWRVRAAMM